MPRLYLSFLFVAVLLAACGQVITISVPGGVSRNATPDGFELLYSPAPHAFTRAVAPQPVRRGTQSERYELRDADCGGSDCGNFRARAEISEIRDTVEARLDRDFWIGWSFFNENIGSVTRETALNTVIGQWRLAGEQPSIFRFVQTPMGEGNWANCNPAFCSRTGAATDDVVVQLDEIRQTLNWGDAQNNGNICRLWGMAANRGRWVDVVVNTNFGTDGFGYLRIWVNGEMRCNYTGQLVSAERARTAVPGPSHRRGIFNSYTQRWSEYQGAAPKPTMVVYYDEYLTGLSRSDVDTRLREASGFAPVD
jgi:hypothetical protein